ncbi:hypothetical protein BANE1_94 [Mycobacterium phage Bane1]|uniref:Uncharacterized protein n=2 Tax=Coopervirus bane1 TaxID=1983109 RepID=T2A9K2_9CAUD|nr:hypothetical protein BANE1_94 [Mycobacterium phage Bane1]AGU92101.1 hypothetical protein BANE1_94 [Mycobacterium phage Bane1]AGU92212.1 hypothetical protein BANE2_94 [Mycobacterium phage Bane2]
MADTGTLTRLRRASQAVSENSFGAQVRPVFFAPLVPPPVSGSVHLD